VPPGPSTARSLDDLVDPLVAEAERLGNLAQRATRKLQPAHRMVEIRAGDVGRAFGVNKTRLGRAGRLQQFCVNRHDVYCT